MCMCVRVCICVCACVRVCAAIMLADAEHTHDEACGLACGQTPGAAIMAKLGAIDDANERTAAVRDNFQDCDDTAMEFLAARLQAGDAGNWQALLLDLQEIMQERLVAGKELLVALLASGEINVLDRKVVEKVKSGECDPSFLNVLQINMQDAQENADQEDGQVCRDMKICKGDTPRRATHHALLVYHVHRAVAKVFLAKRPGLFLQTGPIGPFCRREPESEGRVR